MRQSCLYELNHGCVSRPLLFAARLLMEAVLDVWSPLSTVMSTPSPPLCTQELHHSINSTQEESVEERTSEIEKEVRISGVTSVI